jgi:hypothetical protein
LGCDFSELCFELGKGLYFSIYDSAAWKSDLNSRWKDFGEKVLDYYVAAVNLQMQAVFCFLVVWNRLTGVKEVGRIIAQMVWETREKHLVTPFVKSEAKKRIKTGT